MGDHREGPEYEGAICRSGITRCRDAGFHQGSETTEHRMISLKPLGDQAVLASFEAESEASRWAAAVRRLAQPWLVDVVQAYRSVAVFFDLDQTTFSAVTQTLDDLTQHGAPEVT